MYNPPPPRSSPLSGTMVLVIGIVSLFVVILGPLAWYFGNQGVAAARAGTIPPSEVRLAVAGRICGIVGTVLMVGSILVWGGLAVLFAIYGKTPNQLPSFTAGQPGPTAVTSTIQNPQSPVHIATLDRTPADALSSAIVAQDLAKVEEVLDSHPSLVHHRDNVGSTPLISAAFFGNASIVKILIDHGADVNAKDDFGKTPLGNAVFFHHEDTARVLREHGAH